MRFMVKTKQASIFKVSAHKITFVYRFKLPNTIVEARLRVFENLSFRFSLVEGESRQWNVGDSD